MEKVKYHAVETFAENLFPVESITLYEGEDLEEALSIHPKYSHTMITICAMKDNELVGHWRLIRNQGFRFGSVDMRPRWDDDFEFVKRLEVARRGVSEV
jgi:hypothetical protein